MARTTLAGRLLEAFSPRTDKSSPEGSEPPADTGARPREPAPELPKTSDVVLPAHAPEPKPEGGKGGVAEQPKAGA